MKNLYIFFVSLTKYSEIWDIISQSSKNFIIYKIILLCKCIWYQRILCTACRCGHLKWSPSGRHCWQSCSMGCFCFMRMHRINGGHLYRFHCTILIPDYLFFCKLISWSCAHVQFRAYVAYVFSSICCNQCEKWEAWRLGSTRRCFCSSPQLWWH